MHIPVTTKLEVESGVQAVYGDLTKVYAFPLKQMLAQAHYKLSLDVGQANKVAQFKSSTAAAGDTNMWIPNINAQYIPGGRLLTSSGNQNLPNPGVSRVNAQDEKFNNFPGIIMKYYRRTYTFMNTGTGTVNLQVYEFIRSGNADGESEASPQTLWSASLAADNLMVQTTQVNPDSSDFAGITKLGEVPRKHYKELSENWRHHKLTTYTIDPQQSCMHNCYLPGTYYTVRDLFQDDNNTMVRNKSMAVMFVLNGALAFEGGAPTTGGQQQSHSVMGTAGGYLNYKIESEAMFQGIIQGQSYVRMYCDEDLTTTTEANHVLEKPQIMVPQFMERRYEDIEDADRSGLGATTDGSLVS